MTRPLIFHRSPITASSLSRETRTFEAIASTGADVQRRDHAGPFIERLDLSKIDLGLLVGLPVLNAHRQGSIEDALGSIASARLEGGALVVSIRIARGEAGDRALDLIEDGALRGVSVGYRPAEVSRSEEDGRRVITIRPEIAEISLVPVPADPGSTIRSSSVEDEEIQTLERPENQSAAQNRADTNREIRSIADVAGLSRDWADQQIDAGASTDVARSAAFEAMQARSTPLIRTGGTDRQSGPEAIEHRGEALFARANPSHQLSEPARRFYGQSMVDIAQDSLQRAGGQTTGLSKGEIVTRALHTTSDFSLILGDAVGRTLRQAYQAAPSGLKMVARQTTAPDFRSKHRVQLGEAPTLEPVPESGEFTRGTMAEAEETYRLGTFGRIIGISRQAIVNDDLGAFANLSGRIGAAAAAFEAKELVDLLEANPQMSDGKALFHADHGNLAGSAATLSETSLSEARLAMRKQTGLSKDLIDVTPRYLVVPADLETVAEKLLSQIQATRTDDVNPFASLSLVVEPRLTSATRWYLAADPTTIDGLEYAYLEGAQGPQIETRQGFEVEGVEVKVRLDFGAGFVDFRPFFKNDGA